MQSVDAAYYERVKALKGVVEKKLTDVGPLKHLLLMAQETVRKDRANAAASGDATAKGRKGSGQGGGQGSSSSSSSSSASEGVSQGELTRVARPWWAPRSLYCSDATLGDSSDPPFDRWLCIKGEYVLWMVDDKLLHLTQRMFDEASPASLAGAGAHKDLQGYANSAME